MVPGKRIDLRDYELLHTEKWQLGVYRLDDGKITVSVDRKDHLGDRVPLGPSPNQQVVIKVHQKKFADDREIVIVRSVYFFNNRWPTIQLWKSYWRDFESPDFPENVRMDFMGMQSYWWQKKYHRSVRIGRKWFRLGENEYFKVHQARRDENYNVVSVNILIIEITEVEREVAQLSVK